MVPPPPPVPGAPPPPGPPPPVFGGGNKTPAPSKGAGRGALLGSIQKGAKLKKVPESQKNDRSAAQVGGGKQNL